MYIYNRIRQVPGDSVLRSVSAAPSGSLPHCGVLATVKSRGSSIDSPRSSTHIVCTYCWLSSTQILAHNVVSSIPSALPFNMELQWIRQLQGGLRGPLLQSGWSYWIQELNPTKQHQRGVSSSETNNQLQQPQSYPSFQLYTTVDNPNRTIKG